MLYQILSGEHPFNKTGRLPHEVMRAIVEADPPRRLAIEWRNQWSPELNAEGYSLCTFEIETVEDTEAVKLSVIHSIDRPESAFIKAVSGGWPRILSNLKSLLETGSVVLPKKA